jgi:hypothetical protein
MGWPDAEEPDDFERVLETLVPEDRAHPVLWAASIVAAAAAAVLLVALGYGWGLVS